MGQFGILACRLGPGAHLKGFALPGGVKPENFDYFHELIAHEETTRLGIYNYAEGLASGMVIGLPPLLKFGPKWMHEKIVPSILRGEKKICLAISDPGAGSDVSNISCVAKKYVLFR
jgi:alkylation response protein AidB-like acyl-CoA dehydrogenase